MPVDDQGYLSYNVHDRLRMKILDGSVETAIAREQWQYFQVPDCEPDLRIHNDPEQVARENAAGRTRSDGAEFSTDDIIVPRYGTAVRKTGSGWVFGSRREAGRLVAPWLDYLLVQRGLSLLHAAAVAVEGSSVLITGWGGVGKTSSLAHLLNQPGYTFMSDDWVFTDQDSTIYSFPKPMYIYSYHAPLYPHLFENPPKPLIPPRFAGVVATVRHAVRPAFEKFPRVEKLARTWSPEHMKVMPSQALPGVAVTDQAPLSTLIFLQRGDVPKPHRQAIATKVIVDRMLGIMFNEFSISAREVFALAAGTGLVSMGEWISQKQRILEAALRTVHCVELTVPLGFQAEAVGPAVAELVGAKTQ